MAFGIVLLIILWLLYVLLVRGFLWKIILGIFGAIGIYAFLVAVIPDSASDCLIFSGSHISWAAVIAGVILFLATVCTRID